MGYIPISISIIANKFSIIKYEGNVKVKNTMLDRLVGLLAPHHCYHCGQVGGVLCGNCKYDIVSEKRLVCIKCGRPTKQDNLCQFCPAPYQRAWFVTERTGVVSKIINDYKFNHVKEAHRSLAELLAETLPALPEETVIVPVPTVSSHIRERGYDHLLLIARRLAYLKKRPLQKVLMRVTKTKQRQAGARQRQKQASQAFMVFKKLDKDKIYLIIDDVKTTGATLDYATLALKKAGAKQIWVAVVACSK